jgi:hypothetical protein
MYFVNDSETPTPKEKKGENIFKSKLFSKIIYNLHDTIRHNCHNLLKYILEKINY